MVEPRRRQVKRGDRALIFAVVPLMVLAMAFAGPVRGWAIEANMGFGLFFSVAPSLFVGASLAIFIAIMETMTLRKYFAVAVIVAIGLEGLQWLLPNQTFDLWDIAASAIGAGLSLLLIAKVQSE